LIYQNWWASFLTCRSLSLSLLFPTITIGTTSLLGRRPRDVQSSSFTYKKRSSIKLTYFISFFYAKPFNWYIPELFIRCGVVRCWRLWNLL